MKGQDQLFSTGNDEWETNPETFIRLHEEFDFEVDVCASSTNALLPKFFDKARSALSAIWRLHGTRFFMNPPYTQTAEFMQCAHDNAVIGKFLVVCLVAARTDTRWWHAYVWDEATHDFRPGVTARFLKGREMFFENGRPRKNDKGQTQRAPFPSVVVIFDFRNRIDQDIPH